jgi:hypothetical protein
MSFLEEQWQKHLAVYIKYLELQYTIAFSRRNSFRFHEGCEKENTGDFQSLIMALVPYSEEKDRKMLEQFSGMMQTMEMFKQLAPMMDLMKNIMPDMADNAGMFGNISNLFGGLGNMGGSDDGGDMMMNMLMGMMSPEQMTMYEEYLNDGKEN